MKLQPVITSLLEQDMYKYSMGQAIYHQFSDYKTTWSFKCRNNDVKFTGEMVEEIRGLEGSKMTNIAYNAKDPTVGMGVIKDKR